MKITEIKGDFYFWKDLTGFRIVDPDGWDRSNPDCLEEMITLQEFYDRSIRSTMVLDAGRMEAIEKILKNSDPFAELKKAYSEGKAIQYKAKWSKTWLECPEPTWITHLEYRIKPEPPAKQPYTQESWSFEWVRNSIEPLDQARTLAVSKEGIIVATSVGLHPITWERLMNMEGSNDRVNWVPLYR